MTTMFYLKFELAGKQCGRSLYAQVTVGASSGCVVTNRLIGETSAKDILVLANTAVGSPRPNINLVFAN